MVKRHIVWRALRGNIDREFKSHDGQWLYRCVFGKRT